MATYVFENLTQAQANAITAGDIIAVATASVGAANVGVSISAASDTIQNTTLTVGSKSLVFDAAALSSLSDAGNIVFNDGSSLLIGTNGNDTDASLSGGDFAYLFAGNDTYTAAASGSFVYGGNGSDSLIGGAAGDHLYGLSASGGADSADTIAGGGGGDYIQGNAGNDTLSGEAGSDRIQGGQGNDSIDGGADNDTVNGNTGDDSIDGGSGNDSLRGGQGNDIIVGGTGDDFLQGDLGNDTLDGGAGIDALTGGAGNDIFQFTGASAAVTVSGVAYYDTVLDYTDGLDEFRITNAAGTSTFGDAASSAEISIGSSGAVFTTVSAATTYAQQLLDANTQAYDIAIVKVGGDTYIFYDSTGTQGASIDSIIKVQGVTDTSLFTSADFG
jgi:serralysin